MFLLADVNSMYCACEQVFRPDLKGRPVAVLSNNDGALVAINREGKKLGLKRGMPFFQAREIIKNQNVAPLRGEHGSSAASTVLKIPPHLNTGAV